MSLHSPDANSQRTESPIEDRGLRFICGTTGLICLIAAAISAVVVRPFFAYAAAIWLAHFAGCGTSGDGFLDLIALGVIIGGSWAGTALCRRADFAPRTVRWLLVITCAAFPVPFLLPIVLNLIGRHG